jgi:hypothetical protein
MMMFKKGWQNIIITMNAAQSRQQKIVAQILGPHSSAPSTKGFLWFR